MIGLKFGKLEVLSEVKERNKNGHILYLCKCKCGLEKQILGASLRQGLTTSCGCSHKAKVTKHGFEGTRTYKTWIAMKTRCLNENADCYAEYGGRGIAICDRWVNSFENFIEDMGERPINSSIERIDVNGNYEPSNCRWATVREQQENRRNSVFVVINGKKYTPREYSEMVGLTISGANKKMRREFNRIGNVFIKESDPAYAPVVAAIESNCTIDEDALDNIEADKRMATQKRISVNLEDL